MIKIKYYWLVLLLLTTVVIGILVGKLISIPHFVIDPKINPLHAISIVVTLVIAIVIGIILDQNKETKKIKRDLVLQRTKELYEAIDSLDMVIREKKIELIDVNIKLKKIGISGSCVKSVLVAAEFPVNVDNFFQVFKELRSSLTLTDSFDEVESSEKDIHIESGICRYSQKKNIEIEHVFNQLRNEVFNLQIRVASS